MSASVKSHLSRGALTANPRVVLTIKTTTIQFPYVSCTGRGFLYLMSPEGWRRVFCVGVVVVVFLTTLHIQFPIYSVVERLLS